MFSVIFSLQVLRNYLIERDKFLIQGNMIFLALSEPPLWWFGRYFPWGLEQDPNL